MEFILEGYVDKFVDTDRQTSPLSDVKGNAERARNATMHTKGSVSAFWLLRIITEDA